MEAMIKTNGESKARTLVGITVCQGPGQFRLILTRPYHEAGRVVEIRREDILSVEPLAPGTLGDSPLPAD